MHCLPSPYIRTPTPRSHVVVKQSGDVTLALHKRT